MDDANDDRTWLAHVAIRDLVARYNLFGDNGRIPDVAGLFVPRGVLEYRDDGRFEICSGREEIVAFLERIKQQWLAESTASGSSPRVFHSVGTHVIELVEDERATGIAYVSVIRRGGLAEWGRYVDDYVRHGGQWSFARRRATVDGRNVGAPLADVR